jgi:hypothetical protein
MATRINVNSNELDWCPADDVFDSYHLDTSATDDADAGIFVKVLRRPDDGGGCWHCLLRFRPPVGHAIRITAVAQSDEEVFFLSSGDGREGVYGCNPQGLRHGQTVTTDTIVLAHYHGEPDDVLRAELVPLDVIASR